MECLYGCKSNNICAYCKHHAVGLTVKQMRHKGCLQKQCWYLQKNEQHDWWRQREVIKQKRKNRKEAIEKMVVM